MKYMSSFAPIVKTIPPETLVEVSTYLEETFPGGVKPTNTFGEVHDALLAFRRKNGERLLLNQLAPIYLAVCWGNPLS